jgi:two-component system LytT family response regulator
VVVSELRALIVDDEPLARRGVRQLLAREPDVTIVGECRNGREAVEALRTHAPDLVFLDIQMPDLDGFEVIREYGVERMPPVVFVTAYDEFAVQAFAARALDYLVKPVKATRFAETMTRIRERRRLGTVMHLATELGPLLDRFDSVAVVRRALTESAVDSGYADRLVVITPVGEQLIPVEKIDWIEADDYYARLYVGRTRHLLRESLARLTRRLDPAAFLRVHRSAIIRLDRIHAVIGSGARTQVVLRDGTRIRVSRRRLALLRSRLRQLGSRTPGSTR